jgi:4-nitrophenyl phosphatase
MDNASVTLDRRPTVCAMILMSSGPTDPMSDRRVAVRKRSKFLLFIFHMPPIRALLLDGDGVIWIDGAPISGAIESLNAIRAMGIRLVLVTNNSSKTRPQYVSFLESLGVLGFTPNDIFTSGYATSLYLKQHNLMSAFVSAFDGLSEELRSHGFEVHDVSQSATEVVICGKGDHFTWQEICHGIGLVKKFGARLLAVCPDPRFQMGKGIVVPGSGAVARAFEIACGVKATVMGKPSPAMFRTILDALGLGPEDVMMVGDQIVTDIAFAAGQGARSCLLLSGVCTQEDAENAPDGAKPTYVLPSLVELVGLLNELSNNGQ